MSRSGYSESCEGWELIRWRGAVASAIRGKRGQAFLRKMLAALDALPRKRLIAEELMQNGEVCAIGSVGLMAGIDMNNMDPHDHDALANTFNISPALVQEIEFINDDEFGWRENPEDRFKYVRRWVVNNIREDSNSLPGRDPTGTDSK